MKAAQFCLQFHVDFIYDIEVAPLQLQFDFEEEKEVTGAGSGENSQVRIE